MEVEERKQNICISLFLFPVGSTESLCRPEQHAALERCMDEVLPHKPTEFSVCCLLELFDIDVKSVNHTNACAHIVSFSSVAVKMWHCCFTRVLESYTMIPLPALQKRSSLGFLRHHAVLCVPYQCFCSVLSLSVFFPLTSELFCFFSAFS